MAFRIEEKLVIGVASSALFKLDEADEIFRTCGLAAYRAYQREHQQDVLESGIAFPFVRRLLRMNELFPEAKPVEVVLLSHNDPDTGLRVFNNIRNYGLDITRAAFLTGDSPFKYIPAYNVSLFLSANLPDVEAAAREGFAAGQVLQSVSSDTEDDSELRIAFDFDGVVADSSAEAVFQNGGLAVFHESELAKASEPLPRGPLADLFEKLARLRELEDVKVLDNPAYKRYLKTAIVTSRSAPAHERVVTTLWEWNIRVDQTFFLGGMDKGRILSTLQPHIFFDDQEVHLSSSAPYTPSVHVPFGFLRKK